jgi:hypothetical protein
MARARQHQQQMFESSPKPEKKGESSFFEPMRAGRSPADQGKE